MSKLLDRVRDAIRTLHDSIRTEAAYVLWAKQFVLFHGKEHPLEMGKAEVKAFPAYLAVERDVATTTFRRVRHCGPSRLRARIEEVRIGGPYETRLRIRGTRRGWRRAKGPA